MEIKRQEYVNKIMPYLGKPVIKVISGMRRVGKSTIVRQLIEELEKNSVLAENILYINKESLQWDSIRDYKDLHTYISEYFKASTEQQKYIFIDEIQEIREWERSVNSMLSECYADITITGSNAHLLASDLTTFLSGRYIEFMVYPLTFKEFLDFRTANSGDIRESFKLFLRYGGLPGIHAFELNDNYIFQYLNAIYNTLVLKDVVSRHHIKDPAQLDLIIRYIFDNCGNITTAKRITDYLKNQRITASVDKVINYLNYLEEGFLIHRARRFDMKGLRHLEINEKYFTGDIGLRHGLLGYKDQDIGGLLENIVYLELLHRGYSIQTGKWDDLEVDFIAEKQNERIYIQVAYLLPQPETVQRELTPLEKIPDNYPKMILTMDEFQAGNRNGIIIQNLIDFLLERGT